MLWMGLGFLLWLISVIWFIYLSFQRGGSTGEKVIWAVVNFLFQPLAGIIFFFIKKDGLIPMILSIVALVLYGVGGFSAANEMMQNMPR